MEWLSFKNHSAYISVLYLYVNLEGWKWISFMLSPWYLVWE